MDTTHRRHPVLAIVIASTIGVGFGAASSGALAAAPDGSDLGECTTPPIVGEDVQPYPMPPSDHLTGAGRTAPIPH